MERSGTETLDSHMPGDRGISLEESIVVSGHSNGHVSRGSLSV